MLDISAARDLRFLVLWSLAQGGLDELFMYSLNEGWNSHLKSPFLPSLPAAPTPPLAPSPLTPHPSAHSTDAEKSSTLSVEERLRKPFLSTSLHSPSPRSNPTKRRPIKHDSWVSTTESHLDGGAWGMERVWKLLRKLVREKKTPFRQNFLQGIKSQCQRMSLSFRHLLLISFKSLGTPQFSHILCLFQSLKTQVKVL